MPDTLNFVDKLMEARRRAQLVGRPLTRKEVSGAASGYANIASERLARARALKLEEEGLAIRRKEAHETRKMAEKEQSLMSVGGGAAAGYLIGAEIGAPIGGPLGALLGAGVGFIADKICIIITSCTHPNSYEVEISRQYRDNCMCETELVGYYWLSHYIYPLLLCYPRFRAFVKKWLVDRLVDYGEVALNIKSERSLALSYPITKGFLGLCNIMGKFALAFLRSIEYGS